MAGTYSSTCKNVLTRSDGTLILPTLLSCEYWAHLLFGKQCAPFRHPEYLWVQPAMPRIPSRVCNLRGGHPQTHSTPHANEWFENTSCTSTPGSQSLSAYTPRILILAVTPMILVWLSKPLEFELRPGLSHGAFYRRQKSPS